MVVRIAGAFAVDPDVRASFVSGVKAQAAAGQSLEIWNSPESEPLLTLLVGKATQPALASWRGADGSFVVVDGDVYELGDGAKSGLVAEGVHAAFARGGAKELARFASDAALTIYDAPSRQLTLARDRFGITPLYYAPLSQGLLFASDQVTLARLVQRTLDTDALDYFLARGYVPAPWTFLREVRKVPASHALEADATGRFRVSRYAWLTGKPKISPPRDERNARIGPLFAQSLRRRYRSGTNGAVLLSGGVDSALVLAGVVRLLDERPDCFTFDYGDYDGPFNETEPAARVATHFGVPHHRVSCRPQDLADRARAMVMAYGEPFSFGLHSFALDRIARRSGPLLTGIASEPWGINNSTRVALRFRALPKPVRDLGLMALALARPLSPERLGRADVLVWSEKYGLPTQLAPALLSDAQRRELMLNGGSQAGVVATQAILQTAMGDFEGEGDLDRWRLLQQRSFGAESVYQWNTAWARAYQHDIRHPYLDTDLYNYMLQLTFSAVGKENQRAYAATLMPEEFAHAPKVFHTIPIAQWFRGPLRDFIHATLESQYLQGVFDKAVITRLLADHMSRKADYAVTLWGLASFALWCESVLSPSAPLTAANAGRT